MVAPLVGKQKESVRLSTARGNLWEGAVRSSKTVCSILRWLQYVRTGPAGPLLMTGKTERTLKRNIIDPISAMVGSRRCRYKAGVGEVELFGRTIYVAGANDERAAEKIKGLTLAGAYCDEITTFPKSYFAMLMTRLSVEDAQWFGTTNPESKSHWLKKDYLDKASLHLTRDGKVLRSEDPKALDLHRFSFQLDDNPNLAASYVRSLKLENVGLFYRRYILGEWVAAEGAVFDMFDEDVHVVDILPTIVDWIALGIDHGTTNPLHAVLLGLGSDGKLYITRDWRWDSRRERRQLTNVEYSLRIRAWLADVPVPGSQLRGVQPRYVVVDPSAGDFRAQLHADGLTSRPGDNAVLPGIQTVSSLLATRRLFVHRSCTDLIDEFPSYSWDDKASERGEDVPLKVDDHGIDATRYGVFTTRSVWRSRLTEAMLTAA